MKPPVATKIPYEIERHGHRRQDEYYWMKDDNWQEVCEKGHEHFHNADILKYIQAENAYTEFVMDQTQPLQEKLYEELLSRLQEDDTSVALQDGPYFYYTRTEKNREYPIFCRKKAQNRAQLTDAHEHIWMDVNEMAKLSGSEQYQLAGTHISPDHQYAAYAYNMTGSMNYDIKIRQMITGEELPHHLSHTTGNMVWDYQGEHLLFVTRHPDNGRGYQVKRLNIQTGQVALIYTKPEKFSSMFLSISETMNRQWIMVSVGDHASNEIHMMDATSVSTYVQETPGADVSKLRCVAPLEEGVIYSVEHFQDRLYIHTNKDAKNFQIMKAHLSCTSSDAWQNFVPEQEHLYIESFSLYQTKEQSKEPVDTDQSCVLICEVVDTQNALPRLVLQDLKTAQRQIIEMPDEAYHLYFQGACEFVTDKVIYYYESPVQPYQAIELDLKTQEVVVLKERPTPNYDSSLYCTKRQFAPGHDGVMIPVTIVYKRSTVIDGSAPCFVYGYGSYGSGMPAYFSSSRVVLLDRGFVFVIAHVRGGDDKGYDWYLDGKLDKKKNTFLDFISVCEYLIDTSYTQKKRIAASGASAGGLLMGAVANMRPDLFLTVIADVPFVDLMNTMEDTSLPLTETEWNEWGNPLEDSQSYEYMLSYSPYDNVKDQAYPNMLFNGGISDEQVTYWEPTKMVAKLRDFKTDENLLLLKIKMTAGHVGASKRYEGYRDLAFDYAFCLKTFGLDEIS